MSLKIKVVAIGLVVVLAASLSLNFASAQPVNTAPSSSDTTTPPEGTQTRQQRRQNATNQRRPTHLSDARMKLCLHRKDKINAILSRFAQRGQSRLEVFNKISDRVEAFYVKKGRSAQNYDQLVAVLNTKKASAEIAVQTLKSASGTFSCSAENPKATVTSFKQSAKTMRQALKDYKTDLKNLIVAVKSVEKQAAPNHQTKTEKTQ